MTLNFVLKNSQITHVLRLHRPPPLFWGLINTVREWSQGKKINPGLSSRRLILTPRYCRFILQPVEEIGVNLYRPLETWRVLYLTQFLLSLSSSSSHQRHTLTLHYVPGTILRALHIWTPNPQDSLFSYTEKLTNLPKITELVNSRVKILTNEIWLQTSCSGPWP